MKLTISHWMLLAAFIYIFLWDHKAPVTENNWTVYGSMSCSWTRKQIDYLQKKGIGHKFVDCDKEACEGVEGFPHLVHADGREHRGFTQI